MGRLWGPSQLVVGDRGSFLRYCTCTYTAALPIPPSLLLLLAMLSLMLLLALLLLLILLLLPPSASLLLVTIVLEMVVPGEGEPGRLIAQAALEGLAGHTLTCTVAAGLGWWLLATTLAALPALPASFISLLPVWASVCGMERPRKDSQSSK